jgi:hypothetical protein
MHPSLNETRDITNACDAKVEALSFENLQNKRLGICIDIVIMGEPPHKSSLVEGNQLYIPNANSNMNGSLVWCGFLHNLH